MQSLKIFVTGGAGFIGSSLIRHIINNTNHSVVNLDNLSYAGNLESLYSICKNPRYKFIKVDICETEEIKLILNNYEPNIIMHLAAESHVDRSINYPNNFIKTNIVGTFNLLEQSRIYWNALPDDKKSNFRFHHISTDEVYGDLSDIKKSVIECPSKKFNENSPYYPSSPYSASKASSDHLVRAWFRTYGLPVIISNCSNNYGPYQFPEKLIPFMIFNALRLNRLPIYGKGNQIRDWLYVQDHVNALMHVAIKGKTGESYNIGANNEKTNLEVVKSICSILEELLPIKELSSNIPSYESLITYVQDRPGHDIKYAIDASKIKGELGWSPKESFESGLRKTVMWNLDNKLWIKNVLEDIHKT